MAASSSVDVFALLQSFEANMKWARAHDRELTVHEGKFVAVAEAQILGEADDPAELHRRFSDKKGLYVTYVAPPGLAWVL